MKNLLLVAILALGFTAKAQLFVKPTDSDAASYVFVNNTFIYVENDVELESNQSLTATTDKGIPNILLRNNAQLLQGEGTISKNNKGTGEISIYQEGTVNNFDYNVWGSPVGLSRVEGGGGFTEPEIVCKVKPCEFEPPVEAPPPTQLSGLKQVQRRLLPSRVACS